MEVCIAYMRGKPVMMKIHEDIVYIDGEEQPILGLTKADLEEFSKAIAAIPYSTDQEGYQAMLNAKRTAFLASILGKAVGDDCVNKISQILDSVHYDVLKYLGEVEEE